MKLTPYPDEPLRWLKVVKHVFDKGERWWEIRGDFLSWSGDWNALRAADMLDPQVAYAHCGDEPQVLGMVTSRHDHWLDAAERACAQGQAAYRIYPTAKPGRSCYVGDAGVVVIVVQGSRLVTCFRPSRAVRSRMSAAEATQRADAWAVARVPEGWHVRTARRRFSNYADLQAPVAAKEELHAE